MTFIELLLNSLFLASLIMLIGKFFGAAISWWLIILLSSPMAIACIPMISEFFIKVLKRKNPWK